MEETRLIRGPFYRIRPSRTRPHLPCFGRRRHSAQRRLWEDVAASEPRLLQSIPEPTHGRRTRFPVYQHGRECDRRWSSAACERDAGVVASLLGFAIVWRLAARDRAATRLRSRDRSGDTRLQGCWEPGTARVPNGRQITAV